MSNEKYNTHFNSYLSKPDRKIGKIRYDKLGLTERKNIRARGRACAEYYLAKEMSLKKMQETSQHYFVGSDKDFNMEARNIFYEGVRQILLDFKVPPISSNTISLTAPMLQLKKIGSHIRPQVTHDSLTAEVQNNILRDAEKYAKQYYDGYITEEQLKKTSEHYYMRDEEGFSKGEFSKKAKKLFDDKVQEVLNSVAPTTVPNTDPTQPNALPQQTFPQVSPPAFFYSEANPVIVPYPVIPAVNSNTASTQLNSRPQQNFLGVPTVPSGEFSKFLIKEGILKDKTAENKGSTEENNEEGYLTPSGTF